jgi:hypothetical protein
VPVRIAVAVYLCWAALSIAQQPGLQYDEALLVADAVHMLRSHGELTLPHDPDTWVCPGGRCFPLMTVRYVGPIKAFLCLPLFKMFGANAVIVRIVAALLAAIGVWGVGALVARVAGQWAGGAAALALACNPTYVQMTVFDNNALAAMMAALGLLCFAIRGYLRARTVAWAFAIGAAMGFGIWARANDLWLLVALCVSAIVILRRRIPWFHAGMAIAGGVIAGAPFLIYQVLSRGGTWQGLSLFEEHGALADRVYVRLMLLAELLWTDREHRAMWAGPELGEWSRWLFLAVVLAACAVAFVRGSKWARIAGLTFAILAAIMLPSGLQLSEHHLILMLPAAVAVTVLACNRRIGIVLAVLYFSCAGYWQIAALRGLSQTGGVGMWSDAIGGLAQSLESRYSKQTVRILSWGLNFNLYVLTQGRLHTAETYDRAHDWPSEFEAGGVYLTRLDDDSSLAETARSFRTAVAQIAPASSKLLYPQRNGTGFAELTTVLALAKPLQAAAIGQLSGFYPPEEKGWRWTAKSFSFEAQAPSDVSGANLSLGVYVPDASLQKLGPIVLTARVNGKELKSRKFAAAGVFTFASDVPMEWLHAGANRFDFSLDKALPGSASDSRELGLIVTSFAVQVQ